jgi:histidinol dehydrogenase
MIQIYDDWEKARRTLLRRNLDLNRVPEAVQESIERVFGEGLTPQQAVARILADVRERGDEAVRSWMVRTDHMTLDSLEIPRRSWTGAYESIDSKLREAIELSAERIRAFHSRQPISSWTTSDLGGMLGQRVTPIARVGVYVPGGSAPLPSSLLMAAIPARVAGVHEVVVCTPPDRSRGGRAPDVILAAAHVVGVDRLYSVGGAQAIAALAYGTETIPRVDKIVGAGGLFVTQAEHDVLATAILITSSRRLAEAVLEEVGEQIARLSRADVLKASLSGQGGIVVTPDLETAVRLADEFAPEHLCLSVREPVMWAERIQNAGGLFLGEHSFEVLGDYVAGPSHIMPTGGTARFASPLNVLDFVKITSIVALDPQTAGQLCASACRFAEAEQLTAHSAAAEQREGKAQ